jgi:hypothetical protein
MIKNEIILDGNGLVILLQFSDAPTRETYEFLKEYIDLKFKHGCTISPDDPKE